MNLDCPVAKVTFVGESGVGKSCLVQRYSSGKFTSSHVPTIGVDYALRRLDLEDDRYIRMQLWDTAGQERFRSITLAYYRGASVLVLVHDRSDPEHHLEYWLRQTRENAAPECHVVVFGTKVEISVPEASKAEKWAEDNSLPYYALSAKTGEGVQEAFASIEQIIREKCADITVETTSVAVSSAQKKNLSSCCGAH